MQEANDPSYEIAIGTLDDPNAVGPFTKQVGIESKVVWFDTMTGLPHHTTADERNPADLAKLASRQHPDHDTDVWPPA